MTEPRHLCRGIFFFDQTAWQTANADKVIFRVQDLNSFLFQGFTDTQDLETYALMRFMHQCRL